MIKSIKESITNPENHFDEVFKKLELRYPSGEDPWGLNLKKAKKSIEYIWPIYKNYFRVRVFGKENVGDQPYMVIANHSGQIAIDGMLICTAFAMEIDPPRILRAMVERFFTALPWVGTWGAEGGGVLGDRQNCLKLLNKGESVLAFPEGVRGVAKSTSEYYKLQRFTRGFYRMALTAQVDILPVAVVGAEEVFPWVYQASSLAKKIGLPALPVSPLYFPLPSPIDIYIGEPISISNELSPESSDSQIDEQVIRVEKIIQQMTNEGIEKRRAFFANVRGPKE
tara:strand:- start:10751 stop:11596 length:846 start_codon:yes stop_codon:yes gene_type:complete